MTRTKIGVAIYNIHTEDGAYQRLHLKFNATNLKALKHPKLVRVWCLYDRSRNHLAFTVTPAATRDTDVWEVGRAKDSNRSKPYRVQASLPTDTEWPVFGQCDVWTTVDDDLVMAGELHPPLPVPAPAPTTPAPETPRETPGSPRFDFDATEAQSDAPNPLAPAWAHLELMRKLRTEEIERHARNRAIDDEWRDDMRDVWAAEEEHRQLLTKHLNRQTAALESIATSLVRMRGDS
jgi:hypothetical protein